MAKTFRQRFTNIILCDDVRIEINKKLILIGVYSGDIIVAKLPYRLKLAVYLEYLPESAGEQEMFFKYTSGDDKHTLLHLKLLVAKHNVNSPIILPGVEKVFSEESELKVDCSEDNKKWIRLITKRILIGNPMTWPPSVLPQPS